MRKSAIVAGTGFEGRAMTIKKHCRDGMEVVLKREPRNEQVHNAIAVYLNVQRLGGIFGSSLNQIGYIKSNTAKSLSKLMDSGVTVTAHIKSFWSPDDRDFPRVTLEVTDEI